MSFNLISRGLTITVIFLLSAISVSVSSENLAPEVSDSELWFEQSLFSVLRQARYLQVNLSVPHRVLSSSAANGGEQDSVAVLVNHQSFSGPQDVERFEKRVRLSPWEYHRHVADRLGIQPQQMALMGTAANMAHTGHSSAIFKNLRVDALVTAGVKHNALRAGDTALWFESDDGNQRVEVSSSPEPKPGTINTMLLISHPLESGAMAKAMIVATEAKSAVLQALAVPSTQSEYLATGTGTDQLIIASPLPEKGDKPLKSASGHLKLGELIGTAVYEATLEALKQQSDLTPAATANIYYALDRFGLTQQRLLDEISRQVPESLFVASKSNLASIQYDSELVAAAYEYAIILDRVQYGTLTSQEALAALQNLSASIAVEVSGKPEDWPDYRQRIVMSQSDLISAFVAAVVIGLQEKLMGHEDA